jgi:hypothetical protein
MVKPGFQFTTQLSISVSPLLDLSCRANINWTLEKSVNTTQDPENLTVIRKAISPN